MDYCCNDKELPDDNAGSKLDISAIADAAFDSDLEASALLEGLVEEGNLDAFECAEFTEGDFDTEEAGSPAAPKSKYWSPSSDGLA